MKQGEGRGCLRPEGRLSVGRALDQELDIEFAEPAPSSQEARLSLSALICRTGAERVAQTRKVWQALQEPCPYRDV